MDILIIAVLIIAAVILFLVELFVIPGISLASILIGLHPVCQLLCIHQFRYRQEDLSLLAYQRLPVSDP